jgi:hypothetical protein
MSRLAGNAFRVLGLDSSTGQAAILARRDDIRVDLEMEQKPSFPGDFPVLIPAERTAATMQRLADPQQRLLDELTWFALPIRLMSLSPSVLRKAP